jgi:hypothetical protein
MNAHTASRDLLTSMLPPALKPTVPEMVERLKAARTDRAAWQFVAQKSCLGSKAEADAGDEAAACDDREAILRTAIIAAVDAALEPLGLTFAALQELGL